MPIRTPRGRSAAYRQLWQWPLRSPRRLAATAVVLLALMVGVSLLVSTLAGRATGDPASARGTPDATGVTQPNASAASRVPPVAELSPSILPLSQAPPAALSTASSWATAWVNHPAGMTTEQWLAGLRPFTTEEYLGVLGAVDPANVPASQVTGPPKPVLVSPNSVRVEVPTDTLTLLLVVVNNGTDWRVSRHERVEPGTTR